MSTKPYKNKIIRVKTVLKEPYQYLRSMQPKKSTFAPEFADSIASWDSWML